MRVAVPTSLKTQLSRWENGHAVPEAPYRSSSPSCTGAPPSSWGSDDGAH